MWNGTTRIINENYNSNKKQNNKIPFISSNIIHAYNSFAEVALAIGATDVGLSRIKPNLKVDREGRRSKGRIESN